MADPLPPRELAVLRAIDRCRQMGEEPARRTLMTWLGFQSFQALETHLRRLVVRGLLRHRDHARRAVLITKAGRRAVAA